MWTSYPNSHDNITSLVVTSEGDIGKMIHPKSSKQSRRRNEEKRCLMSWDSRISGKRSHAESMTPGRMWEYELPTGIKSK